MAGHPHNLGKKKVKPENWGATAKRIWSYLAEKRGQLSLVFIMILVSSALGLLGPYLIGLAIDTYIVPGKLRGLGLLLAAFIAVYALQSIGIFLQNYWMIGIAQHTVYTMRSQLFRTFHHLPISYFEKRQHGELMSRITNDIDNVSSTLNSSFIQIVSSVLTLAGTVGVMLWLSPLLTALTLIIVPMLFAGMKWITARTGPLYKKQQKNTGVLNGYIEEIISGQRIVKSFSQEKRVTAEFLEKNENLRQSGYWSQSYAGFIPKLMNMLNNLSFAIIAGIGGYLAFKGMITIGVIVIFAEYSRQFTRPLNELANQFNTLLSAVAGAERVFEILDEEKEENDEHNAVAVAQLTGNVEFQDVSFSYEGHNGDTVSSISFVAQQGQMTALVGPTGAGKTTLFNLLSRFYDPEQGSILFDGMASISIKRESLRSHMAFVLQDSYLFQGTIRENIRYGRLDASDEEVEKAAHMANAHSFIMKLPNQYDTLLKPEGSGISQGQRQLLSIARAMVADPAILLLDEATSSIDTITELKIQEALQRLFKGRTSFVIAHRLNTIQRADQIVVLQEGEVIEKGTHEELIAHQGFYHSLYQNQNKEETG
ncbi:ABC transporter ATP-binding protein [Fictibacillus iocasae]|uniref:ABC transporter ATP-binding protein n=1 Tax=Fictibacillus iocasae TaxID=2715437 RepID=A0ABW2NUL2_9BACL